MNLRTYTVDPTESRRLEQILTTKPLGVDRPDSIISLVKAVAPVFLPQLTSRLCELKNGNSPAINLTGLPTFEGLDEIEREHHTKVSSIFISSIVGLPFQYQQQNHGQLAARVSPEKGFETTNSSLGSSEFGWHSDDSFLTARYRTNWIALTGFLNRDHVATKLSSIASIARELSSDTIGVLLQPRFSLKLPISFLIGKEADDISNIPLIWFDGSRSLNISAAMYNTRATDLFDTKATTALADLNAAASRCAQIFDLQPGTMIVFNNDKFLHARSQIPGERVVFRTYIRSDLNDLRSATDAPTEFVFDLRQILHKMKTPKGFPHA